MDERLQRNKNINVKTWFFIKLEHHKNTDLIIGALQELEKNS